MDILTLLNLAQTQPNQAVRYYIANNSAFEGSYVEHALCAACYVMVHTDNARHVVWDTMHIDYPDGSTCYTCKARLRDPVGTSKLSFWYPEEFHRLTQGNHENQTLPAPR